VKINFGKRNPLQNPSKLLAFKKTVLLNNAKHDFGMREKSNCQICFWVSFAQNRRGGNKSAVID